MESVSSYHYLKSGLIYGQVTLTMLLGTWAAFALMNITAIGINVALAIVIGVVFNAILYAARVKKQLQNIQNQSNEKGQLSSKLSDKQILVKLNLINLIDVPVTALVLFVFLGPFAYFFLVAIFLITIPFMFLLVVLTGVCKESIIRKKFNLQ